MSCGQSAEATSVDSWPQSGSQMPQSQLHVVPSSYSAASQSHSTGTLVSSVPTSSSALSSRDGRLHAGIGDQCPPVWTDAGERGNFSLWLRVFAIDLPEVVDMTKDGCRDDMDVRVLADGEQAQKRGMKLALQDMEKAGALVVAPAGSS